MEEDDDDAFNVLRSEPDYAMAEDAPEREDDDGEPQEVISRQEVLRQALEKADAGEVSLGSSGKYGVG